MTQGGKSNSPNDKFQSKVLQFWMVLGKKRKIETGFDDILDQNMCPGHSVTKYHLRPRISELLDLVLLRPKLQQLLADGREVAVQALRQRQITWALGCSENRGFHPQIAILVRRISGQPTDLGGTLRSKQTQTHNENHWEPTTHARVCNGDDESWVTRHLFLRLKHNYPHTIPQQNSRIWVLLIRSHTSPTSGQKKVRIKVEKPVDSLSLKSDSVKTPCAFEG